MGSRKETNDELSTRIITLISTIYTPYDQNFLYKVYTNKSELKVAHGHEPAFEVRCYKLNGIYVLRLNIYGK